MVARLPLAAEGVEHQTVGAELIVSHAVDALVVLVALPNVLEGSVALGAGERLA